MVIRVVSTSRIFLLKKDLVVMWEYYYLSGMKAKTNKKQTSALAELESVKLKKSVVNLVRDNKTKTGVPIGIFFEQSAIKNLNRKTTNT